MNSSGWVIYSANEGTFGVMHTSGFFVAGFDSKIDAALWLQDYVLRRAALQYQQERARERLLARMHAHGRVS